jgi:xylulokinase
MAAVAIGNAKIEDIAVWNPVTSTIRAEPSEVHDRQYRLFRRLYEQTKDIAAELSQPI